MIANAATWLAAQPVPVIAALVGGVAAVAGTIIGAIIGSLIAHSTTLAAADRAYGHQTSIEEQKFAYQRALDARRFAHELDVEDRRHRRVGDALGRRIQVVICDIEDVIARFYIRGSPPLDVWADRNERLRQLIESADANDLSSEAFLAGNNLLDQSVFTRHFIINDRLAKPEQATDDFPLNELIINDLAGVVYTSVDVADAIGQSNLPAKWRSDYERRVEQIEERRSFSRAQSIRKAFPRWKPRRMPVSRRRNGRPTPSLELSVLRQV